MDGLFTSFTGGMALVIVALFGLLAFKFLQSKKPIKEVLFLSPRDRRGERLRVTRETDRSVFCERSNPVHRFFKLGPAYEFHENGRLVTRFFAVEGSAYTADLRDPTNPKPIIMTLDEYLRGLWGDMYDKMPSRLRKKIEGKVFSVAEYLRTLFGKEYEKIPQKLRDAVEGLGRMGIIVDVEHPSPEEFKLPNLTSDHVNVEEEAAILRTFTKAAEISTAKREFYQLMVGIGLGIGIALILIRWGVL